MFLQVFQGRVTDPQAFHDAMERWVRDLAPGASGWLGSTAGVTDDGTLVATARFTSEETARRNSDRPEQGEWWAETSKLFDGDVTFHDCPQVLLVGAGGSDQARFVQVIQGRSDNLDRFRELAHAFEPMMATYRPDLLGFTVALHGDDGFTEIAYFTNEEEARRGESQEPPAEVKALLEEERALTKDVVYYDLRDPWLYSPRG